MKNREPSLPLLQVFKSPPGGVLFWLSRHKKEPKNVGFFLISTPCIFEAKNLIKPGRSRFQSPGTASDSKEPRLPFCQLLGSEAKGWCRSSCGTSIKGQQENSRKDYVTALAFQAARQPKARTSQLDLTGPRS